MNRPCPFCGDRDIRFKYDSSGWVAECGSCPCELRWYRTEEDAREGWNKRATGEVERLHALINRVLEWEPAFPVESSLLDELASAVKHDDVPTVHMGLDDEPHDGKRADCAKCNTSTR